MLWQILGITKVDLNILYYKSLNENMEIMSVALSHYWVHQVRNNAGWTGCVGDKTEPENPVPVPVPGAFA